MGFGEAHCRCVWRRLLEIREPRLTFKDQFKFKGKYFLCLLIGTYTEALGIVLRIVFRSNTHSLGLYIIMYMLVILSVSMAPLRRWAWHGRNVLGVAMLWTCGTS